MSDLLCGDLGEVAVEESSDVLVHWGSFLVRLHLHIWRVAIVEGILYHGRVATVQVKGRLLAHHYILRGGEH